MDSIADNLRADMECEDVLPCLYGLTETDVRVFEILAKQGDGMEIDTIAEIVERDRGTVFRSLKRLRKHGFVSKEQVNYESGGYYHVYHVRNSEAIVREMQESLNQVYANADRLVGQFREKYSTEG